MKQIAAVWLVVLFLFPVTLSGADFDGDSRDDIAIFRPAAGLWAIRGVTRIYFGGSGDMPIAGDYDGNGIAEAGIFRGSSGLWAVRDVTRVYFGSSSDTAITGGGGQRTYEYVVKPDDGDDLVRALESSSYRSVFVPAGDYIVSETINVTNVRQITGESNLSRIQFVGDAYLSIESVYCTVEKIQTRWGGSSSPARGSFYVYANYVTLRDCRSEDSHYYGFQFNNAYGYFSAVNCIAKSSDNAGFYGGSATSHYTNCAAVNCYYGFQYGRNLSSCSVWGNNNTISGYRYCKNVTASTAKDCTTEGFLNSDRISGCFVDGDNHTTYGFYGCENISASTAEDCSTYGFNNSGFISACTVDGKNHTNHGFYNCDYLSSCYVKNCTNNFVSCLKMDYDSCNK